jgi:threonine dehydrogenase-like Zn-dependent dehydrogenase
MRIGVLGTGRIGLMHARNLAQTTGVDEVVLMGRNQARLAVSVEHVCAAIQPDAPSALAGNLAPRGRGATVTLLASGWPRNLMLSTASSWRALRTPIRRSPCRSRAPGCRHWWRSRWHSIPNS